MLVLADLEETLIEDWTRPVIVPHRLEIVRTHLAAHPHAKLGLMSWAVWDDRDMEIFNRTMRPMLQQTLGVAFDPRWQLSMDEWGKEMMTHARKLLPRDEMFDIFGKEEVFLCLARRHPEWVGQEVFLFDDAVAHCVLDLPDRKSRAHMVNVAR